MAEELVASRPPPATRVIAPFVGTCALMVISWLATGASLGLFLAGLFLAIVLVPTITLMTDGVRSRLVPITAIVNGIAIVWLLTCFTGTISVSQWFACYLLLLAICIALAGFASVLDRFRIHPIIASAIIITLATLWTTWPIWLSATMRDWSHPTLVHWLVQLNPALAINGVLAHLGPWSQMPMAYHLTDLGQNIAYSLPAYGIACIVAHLLIGYTLLLWSARKSRSLP